MVIENVIVVYENPTDPGILGRFGKHLVLALFKTTNVKNIKTVLTSNKILRFVEFSLKRNPTNRPFFISVGLCFRKHKYIVEA
jgi:hypothetical protein